MNCEDDPARVMYQRLEAAGADLTRVHVLREMTTGSDERPIAFPADIDALREVVVHHNIGLVVIDPLVGFVGDDVKVYLIVCGNVRNTRKRPAFRNSQRPRRARPLLGQPSRLA